MDTSRRRGRSKSSTASENDNASNEENSVEQSSENLNGENKQDIQKTAENDDSEANVDGKGSEVEETMTTHQSRKRKASEMKSEDENANEEAVNNKDVASQPLEATATENVESKELVSKVPECDVTEDKQQTETKPDPVDDLSMLPKQMLGKGKRARIPNKRYSDIMLSPQSKVNKSSENGSERNESESDSTMDVDTRDDETSSASGGLSPTSTTKKMKMSVDITDSKYLKPFNFGWKRELVWRAAGDSGSTKRQGDIYYYTPTGRKIRSMRELAENLKTKDLTLDNFTFIKDSLGTDDPEKEIIREAKAKSNASTVAVNKKIMNTKVSKSPRSPKLSASPKPPTRAISGKASKVDTSEEIEGSNSKAKTTKSNFKIKLPTKKDSKKGQKDEEEVETSSTSSKSVATRRSSKWSNSGGDRELKSLHPCSFDCSDADGSLPSLQCTMCLCLFHASCVGHTELSKAYICKNCEKETLKANQPMPILSPPPLKPINYLNSYGALTMPKLQRIPRALENPRPPVNRSPLSELPKLTPRPSLSALPEITRQTCPTETSECCPSPPNSPKRQFAASENTSTEKSSEKTVPEQSKPNTLTGENKSIVGSVTTWLPHNSKIVNSIQQCNPVKGEISGPQMVEYLAGRKFLIIPKHNFMSISPSIAATALSNNNTSSKDSDVTETSVTVDSASLGPVSLPNSKPEPESPSKPVSSQHPEAMETEQLTSNTVTSIEVDSHTSQEGPVADDSEASAASAKSKKRLPKVANDAKEDSKVNDFMQNLSYGYTTLLYVFQYLKVQDLLRAGCVCTMWRDIANHPILWKTVRMKNSQVHSFEGLTNTLAKHSTHHLDLRKMLLPPNGEDLWPEFSAVIGKAQSLKRIELCRCPAVVVEKLAVSNPGLEVINALTIKCESMSLEPLKSLANIKELRLKSTCGLTLTSDIDSLRELKQLRSLSLTSIKDMDRLNLKVIAELTNLESLDLGECSDFPSNFGTDILIKLEKLEKLRLEKGQGSCHTFEILEAVKCMKNLEQLELVNFDIKAGFDKALGACLNIKKLLIIPTYISQSATTNHMVLGGVLRLQKTLSHFVWGVTLELLRVTELFVDQCEEPKKDKKPPGNGDSIPVLKPVPLLTDDDSVDIPPAHDPPQVEILALPSLQKLLMQNLPSTRVKILKIPFHATWRQSITDSVN